MGLSLAHRTQGNYLAALNAFEIVLGLEGLDPSIKRLALINLGELYIELGNYNRAIEYFKQNAELAETSTDLKIKMDAYEKLGNTYFDGGFYNKANEQYLLVLDLAKQYNYPEQQVTALANLAWSHSKGNLKVAKEYAKQSVELSKHIVDPWRKSESLHALVTLQHYTQDPDSIKTANLKSTKQGFPC